MRELGINVEETAIMSAVIPVVAIIMPPVAGMIADKIGNFKILLALFSTLGGLAALLLLIVPIGRITITYPDQLVMGMSCNPKRPDTHMSLTVYQEHHCEPAHPFKYNSEVTIESCGFACQAFMNPADSAAILSTPSYGIHFLDTKSNYSKTVTYELENTFQKQPKQDLNNHRTLTNNERYKTSIRKLSENAYFFPTVGLFNFSCDINEETLSLNVTDTNTTGKPPEVKKVYVCRFGTLQNVYKANAFRQKFSVQVTAKNTTEDFLENMLTFDVLSVSEQFKDEMKYHQSMCSAGIAQTDQHVSINIPRYYSNTTKSYKDLNLGNCAPRCIVTTPRMAMCDNAKSVFEVNMRLTFWSYLVVRVFIAMIGGTAFAMFEGAVIAILREKKADYGLQRIYASIGGMISSPTSGLLIDYFSRGKGYTDFRPAVYLYAVLKIISGILMLGIHLEFKSPARNVVTDVLTVLKKVEVIALFISCFILGTTWGYIESFLFWLLQDLGGTRTLMGFTITVGGIAGIPLLVLSGPIIKRIGHANVIFIGFLFYGIRLMGYSIIYNPWHCLIFEAMESVTSSLSFTAAVTYAAKLSSVTTDSSIQGMLGGIYYGVGKGSGSLIGGYLMKLVGTRPTYQIFAAMTVVTGILYFCFNHFCIKRSTDDDEDGQNEQDITKVPVDLPTGFVEVELMPNWKVIDEDSVENQVTKKQNDTVLNGHVNSAYDKNENDKTITDDSQMKIINEIKNIETKIINDETEKKNDTSTDKTNSKS
ncbi:uncharacterized protein CBL_14239 [Carabus blaptoides fortunei]